MSPRGVHKLVPIISFLANGCYQLGAIVPILLKSAHVPNASAGKIYFVAGQIGNTATDIAAPSGFLRLLIRWRNDTPIDLRRRFPSLFEQGRLQRVPAKRW